MATEDPPSELPEPKSPCVSVCIFDSRVDLCAGCYRTLEEIQEWHQASNERKWEIVEAVRERRAESDA